MPRNLQEHDVGYRSVTTRVPDQSKADEAVNNHPNRSLEVQDQQAQQGFQEQGFDCLAQAQCPRLIPKVIKLDNTAGQAAEGVTPTSTLSAWCPSDIISNVLDGSGSAAPAGAELQQQVHKNITAHPLTSICEEWENDATFALTCQEVTSHAIDIESDECSCAPSHVAQDEEIAACSPFLVLQQRPIGKGTFGTVFKARLATDPSHRYPLAIKQMGCDSAKTYRIVKHESDLMCAMHKAGLVCIPEPYDLHWLPDQGKAFLVMERLHGFTLEEVIDSVFVKTPNKTPEVQMHTKALLRSCAVALIKAVHEMHTSGFCHADLKNSNAMVTCTEGTVTVRLIDLACSQQQKPWQRRVRGGGTLHHMAPELVENYIAKTAGLPSSSFNGFACDMWALGVMLIQLLTGNLPFWPKHGFDYQSMQALLAEWASRDHGHSSSPVLQQLRELTPAAADIIQHMLVMDVRARMTSAQAVQHEFCIAQ
ncbi:hypothetical protein ABBQ32_011155 [Trebouxia sp. C0010 RCD-2024]